MNTIAVLYGGRRDGEEHAIPAPAPTLVFPSVTHCNPFIIGGDIALDADVTLGRDVYARRAVSGSNPNRWKYVLEGWKL